MKILSDAECEHWLTVHGFDYVAPVRAKGAEGFVALPNGGMSHEFGIPSEASRQLLLARRLARWPCGSDVLLWFTNWAVYTEEQADLFREFRRRFGEERWLMEAPGHLLDLNRADDVWTAAQLLLYMTAFNWEGFVLQGNRRLMIWMADEIIETYTLDREKALKIKIALEELYFE